MKLKKKGCILLAFVILLVLSGCYEMEARKKIMSDGSANVEIKYDFTAMVEMMHQMPEEDLNDGLPDDFSDFCKEFKPENVNMLDAQCIVDGYKVTIRGSLPRGSVNVFLDGDTYSYNIKDVYDFLNRIDINPDSAANGLDEEISLDDEPSFSDEKLREMGAMAPMMNLRLTYIIEMEGEIIRSDVGQVNGNVVTINMFDIPDVENPVVIAGVSGGKSSFDLDSSDIMIIGGILIVIIIAIIIILSVAKSKKPVPSQEIKPQNTVQHPVQGSARVGTLVKWIKQHEDQHSEQVLRQILESRGYTKEEIEQAFTTR